MFRKAAQKPGSPGLRHKPPVFLQAKTHAPRPFRSLPQAGRAQKRTVKSPSLRSKLAAWRRHAGSLPQAGRAQKRTVKSPSLRSKLAAWRRHAGSLPQAGRARKRTVKSPGFAEQTRSVAQTRRIPATGRACAKAHSNAL